MTEPALSSSQQPTVPYSTQEERFVHLLKELNKTVDTIRQNPSHASLAFLIAHAVAPPNSSSAQSAASLAATKCTGHESRDLRQNEPVEVLLEPKDGSELAGLSSNARLQADSSESRAKDARIQALNEELAQRNGAYKRLSAAHRAVLIRLEHCQRLLTSGNTTTPTTSGSEARGVGHTDDSDKFSSQTEQRKQPEQPLSQQVQFVSTRQVRHAKRPSKKIKTENKDDTRHVKREPSPLSTPGLQRNGTSAITNLDLDTFDVPKSTPRKLRHSPVNTLDYTPELARPLATQHINDPPLAAPGSYNDTVQLVEEAHNHEATGFAEPSRRRQQQAEMPITRETSVLPQTIDLVTSDPSLEGPGLAGSAVSGGGTRSVSPGRHVLAERDSNSCQTPYNHTSSDMKGSGKRRRADHGASKIQDLAEDYDTDTPSGARANKGRRLHSLLDEGSTESMRVPSPRSLPRIPRQSAGHVHPGVIKPTNGKVYDLTVLGIASNGEWSEISGRNSRSRSYAATREALGNAGSSRRVRPDLAFGPVQQNVKVPHDEGSVRGGRRAVCDPQTRTIGDQVTDAVRNQDSRAIQQRGNSPPGFWNADMPTTQELEALRNHGATAQQADAGDRHR